MEGVARVIFVEHRPCEFFPHRLRPVATTPGCTYQACACGTRRVVIEPEGEADAHWLRTGEFATEQLSVLSGVQSS